MFWMLVGGGGLFAMILIGVLVALLGGDHKPVVPSTGVTAAVTPKPAEAGSHLSDEAFLASAEPMARKFLEAKSVDEILPLVRNPKEVEPKIRKIHPDGKIVPSGMSGFNTASEVRHQGSIASVYVRTGGFEGQTPLFRGNPGGHSDRLGKLGRMVGRVLG